MKTSVRFGSYHDQFFLEREMFQTKVVEKIKTYILYTITFFLTPWSRVLPQRLAGPQLVKKFRTYLWNPKIHCRIHKSPRIAPILNQINPVHAPSHFLNIHFNLSSNLYQGLPSGLFPSGPPHPNHVCTSPVPSSSSSFFLILLPK